MPTRSAQEKLDSYRRKIRKLEERELRRKEKEKAHRRIRRPLDSSDDENTEDANNTEPQGQSTTEPQAGPSTAPGTTSTAPGNEPTSPAPAVQAQDAVQSETTESPSETTLDPELLSALGASTSDTPDFGENIHDSLANLWTPILKKGLSKEDKDKLSKEYLIPGNCKLLQSPKLNAEISAAVAEVVRGRDKKLVRFQQQLGVGIAAVNRGMDTLLKSDNKIHALKQLSDGCRFLTDFHNLLTKDRIKLATPSLDKNFLTVIQDSERDDTLFGNSLSEKIKASQAINRQSSQIKATINQKTAAGAGSNTQTPANRPAQGNWSGPPRYPSNRGGRGGHRKPTTAAPRRTYPTTQTQSKTANQSKTRVPPQ